jgi:hypothetical protein
VQNHETVHQAAMHTSGADLVNRELQLAVVVDGAISAADFVRDMPAKVLY